MGLRTFAWLAAFAAALSTASAQAVEDPFADFGNGSFTVVKTTKSWEKALFLCAGTESAATYALGYPAANGASRLFTLKGQSWTSKAVAIGEGDPGAGQIYYPLTGAVKGVVHAFNPGMVDSATTPTVASLDVGGAQTTCRWAEGTVLLAVTPKRTVQITATAPGYRYEAFAPSNGGPIPANSPTVSVDGGGMTGDYVTQTYSFSRSGYTYRIVVGGPQGKPSGTLSVLQGGKTVLSEPLLAYTLNGL